MSQPEMKVDLKKVRPVGIVIILLVAVLAIITCFTIDLGVPEHYVSEHDTAYYSQSRETMEQLHAELREKVFPGMDGVADSYLSVDGTRVVIVVKTGYYDRVKAVLERDFDSQALFQLVRE